MRFMTVRTPAPPGVPSRFMDYPLALDEEPVCNVQEEYDRIEGLPLHWDEDDGAQT